jgi:radical SAM superfamily enzyme YgiQ (UPF0313 family)
MKKLDCLLISTPIFYENSGSIWEAVNSNFPPLGLASIAAYVRQRNYSVKIIDCNTEAISVNLFHGLLGKKFSSYDIRFIGLTSMTSNIKKAYVIAKICRQLHPESKIVIGGVHATFLPEEVLSNESIDYAVLGEGEITFEEMLSGKNIETIEGLAYKKGKKIEINQPRKRIQNLDELPMPAYDLLPIRKYRPAKGTYKKLPAMSMMTSRGCPGRCTFCSKTLGFKLTFRSAEKIFKEIKYLHDKWGIRQILFYDDTFTVFRNNVIRLCKLLIKSKMDISWTCFARVDFINYYMLRMMKKAGCHQIMYGVENIDEIVLRNINKKITMDKVEQAVRWTKKAGIECRLSFMVGNPGDNPEVVKKNIEFVKKLNPDLVVVNITTPFPGTVMFNWAKENNLLLSEDWDDYNLTTQVMRLENLNEKQIYLLYKLFYRKFYIRPVNIIKKIMSIRSFQDFDNLLVGLRALLSFLQYKV